ncbi:MAG: hypothetical protein R3Y50_06055 [Rikenellaceae bacterium]
MKRGENLVFVGRVLYRSAKSDSNSDFIELQDLEGLDIRMSLNRSGMLKHMFTLTKKGAMFVSAPFSTVDLCGDYEVEVALVADNQVVVCRNEAYVNIQDSALGKNIAETLILTSEVGNQSTTTTLPDGEFEYIVELAQTGSEAEINSWSDCGGETALSCFLGTILKGDSVNIYYSDSREEAIESSKNDQNNFYVWE